MMVTETETTCLAREPHIVERLIILVLTFFVFGFVFMCLFRWLISPVFHIDPLTHGEAMGVGFVIAYMTRAVLSEPNKDLWLSFFQGLGKQIIILAIGFLLSLCI